MSYSQGDVLLVSVVFSDQSGTKRRPVMVVYSGGDDDLMVAPITSHTPRPPHDVALVDWQKSGLRLPSCARLVKLATVKKSAVVRQLGRLSTGDRSNVKAALGRLFADILAE